jgi:6-phosphogluconolactonase (cycloisomerase 2 family)
MEAHGQGPEAGVRRLVSFPMGCSVLFFLAFLTACSGTAVPGNSSGAAASGGSGSGSDSGSGSGTGGSAYVDDLFLAYGGSTNPGQMPNEVSEYGVDASGALTQTGVISNAPNVIYSLASNQQYLFLGDGSEIDTYPLRGNGSLTLTATTKTPNGGTPAMLSMDRTGQTLYMWDGGYTSYSIGANGALGYLNSAPSKHWEAWNAGLSFTPNDEYAYTSDCTNGTPVIYGFQRAANGALTAFDTQTTMPTGFSTANSPQNLCLMGAAVASNNYVVFALQADNNTTQLAVYAIAPNGTLFTTDTAATMTTTGSVGFSTYAFDPTGTWLAVGNSAGLYLYQFANGQLTLTSSVPVTNGPPQQLKWDASGHIFWYGQDCCGVFVAFSVSSSGTLTQLPANSPYGPLGGTR